MNKKYTLYIFDFDGTLGDTKECVVSSFQKSLSQNSLSQNSLPTVDRTQIIQLMGLSLEDVLKKLTDNKYEEDFYKKLVTDYRIFYKEFLTSKTEIFPEVAETLKLLKEKNIRCTIATSKKTEFAKLSCQYLGIDQYIDFYIGDDMVTKKKPDPEMLTITLEKFNTEIKDAVMIGDSTFDIEMGNAIGMDTIAVTWGSHSKEMLQATNPTNIIDSFSQLLQFA